MQKFLDKVNRGVKGGRVGRPEVRVAQLANLPMAAGAGGVGAGLGFMAGGTPGALIGGGTGILLEEVGRRLGPKAAQSIAYEAMVNPDILRRVTKKYGANAMEGAMGRLIDTLERRGILTLAELVDERFFPEEEPKTLLPDEVMASNE